MPVESSIVRPIAMTRVFFSRLMLCALLAATGLSLACGSGCAPAERAVWAGERDAAESAAGQPERRQSDAERPVDFARDIRPLLAENCFKCHGPGSTGRQADLRLDRKESALAPLYSGEQAIVPGDADSSVLYERITSEDATLRMPPPETGKTLSVKQIALVKRWIDEGAKWRQHWAYIAPRQVPLPAVKNAAWPQTEFDYFILARMEAEGLAPSKPAARERWLRRVTFDLTGLPPTLEDLDAFLADESSDAYEKVADRLLRSPRYGERMASHWLDLARYADTHGYHIDAHRDMWRWRDWVIDAFNDNQPFDRFTIEQLAGDKLPHPTLEQIIATGFNRNTMINFEDGVFPEEYRAEYVADRVVTTATVWLGQTMICARCHDHKYDPITQRDFYGLFAILNQVPEEGLEGTNGNAAPMIKAPTREQERQLQKLGDQVASLKSAVDTRAQELLPKQVEWERSVVAGEGGEVQTPGDMAVYLPLDEAADDRTLDAAAKEKRFAAIKGFSQLFGGKFGKGLSFGGHAHLELADAGDYDRDDAFTATAWVFPTTLDEMTLLARSIDTKERRGWELFLDRGRIGFRLVNYWPDDRLEVLSRTSLKTFEWRHVAVAWDGSGTAAGVTICVDGEPVELEIVRDRLAGSIKNDRLLTIGGRGEETPMHGILDDVRLFARRLSDVELRRLAGGDPIREIAHITPERRSPEQTAALRSYFLERDADYLARKKRLDAKRKELRQVEEAVPTTMVMADIDPPRETHLLVRGDYRHPGAIVPPGTPACLPPMADDLPRDRLGLARWIVDPNNPLTARVTVNHFWQMLFGTGLVATSEDFGTRGELPSHPELLDWLAVDFVRSGWDVKRLLRTMVLSSTYRQSAEATPELLARDPHNRLLARGPRVRLPAEMIRDHALATSGLLRERIGGPSVFPYQPDGLWREISYNPELFSAQVYITSEGDDVFRRSLYTFWKRNSPPPTMTIFDATSREICTMRRPRTSTPYQALALLNDPQFVEAARVLAERVMHESDAPRERITLAFRRATSRRPREAEITVLERTLEQQLEHYRADPDAAGQLLAIGDSPRDRRLDPVELAAWSVVMQMILNLNEATMK